MSGLFDLHRVTTNLHVDMKDLLTDTNAAGDTLMKEFLSFWAPRTALPPLQLLPL